MTSKVFIDHSVPVIDAVWLNDVNVSIYTALGNAGVAPLTAAQVVSNLGLVAAANAASTANPLSQFASTTSAQLLATVSDKTGTGALVFANGPTLIAPILGTPASGVATNLTGTATALNIGGNAATATSATIATTATVANRTDSGEVTIAAAATTGDIFAAVANSILWDDAGGANGCGGFANAAKAGMERELRCNGPTRFTGTANLIIEGVPNGYQVTMNSGALIKVRAITTTQFKMTYSLSGTFTITGTGFTVNPTATASYSVVNGLCKLYIPQDVLTGTSNAATFGLTGMPACIIPVSLVKQTGMLSGQNNSAFTSLISLQMGATWGLLLSNNVNGWTNSGTKVLDTTEFIYSLA